MVKAFVKYKLVLSTDVRNSNFNECKFGNLDKTREWYFYRGDKIKRIKINSNGIARIDDFEEKFFCVAWNPYLGQTNHAQYKVMTTFSNGWFVTIDGETFKHSTYVSKILQSTQIQLSRVIKVYYGWSTTFLPFM